MELFKIFEIGFLFYSFTTKQITMSMRYCKYLNKIYIYVYAYVFIFISYNTWALLCEPGVIPGTPYLNVSLGIEWLFNMVLNLIIMKSFFEYIRSKFKRIWPDSFWRYRTSGTISDRNFDCYRMSCPVLVWVISFKYLADFLYL